MLASNGSSLSDRFLKMLGKFAQDFGLTFIVDEIMTGGRCGVMLMVQNAPKEFQCGITHVTMGKWTQKGLVLVSTNFFNENVANTSHTEPRMLSRHVDCRDVAIHWEAVQNNLINASERRAKVIKKLKLKDSETWGKGTLIFVPLKRRGLNSGLLNRLLPKLNLSLRIKPIAADKNMKGFSKNIVNNKTISRIKEWLNDCYYEKDYDEGIIKLIKYIVKNPEVDHEFRIIHETLFKGDNPNTVTSYLHRLREANLLTGKQIGIQRTHRWIVSDLCQVTNYVID